MYIRVKRKIQLHLPNSLIKPVTKAFELCVELKNKMCKTYRVKQEVLQSEVISPALFNRYHPAIQAPSDGDELISFADVCKIHRKICKMWKIECLPR